MFNNKIIFISYCQDHLRKSFGADKMESSFKYFHPDIPIVVYRDDDIKRVYSEYNTRFESALPFFILDAKKKFNSEYVCHIDADSLVLGRLDAILETDYEIASCLNNTDIGDRDERQNRPKELWGLPNNKYVNCGCLSTNSIEFLNKWSELNNIIIERYGGVKTFWMCDQNWMNVLFHYGGFKSKILDPSDKNVFYGASANTASQKGYKTPESIIKEYKEENACWNSWQDIEYVNDKFTLHGREVKLLHKAGGGKYIDNEKLHWDLFNPEILPHLQNITKYNK